MHRFAIAPEHGVAARCHRARARASLGLAIVLASLVGWAIVGAATAAAAPDLSMTTDAGGDFVVGQDTAFILTVYNQGSSPTVGTTTVTDTLPASMTFDSVLGSGWTCAGSTTVTCTTTATVASPGSLPPIALYVVPTGAAVPTATNQASVSNPGDTNTANNTSGYTATVAFAADMSIGLAHVGAPLKTAQQETINIRVHNEGYYRVDGTTTVSSAVPPGLQVVSVTGGSTWSCSAVQSFTCTTTYDGGSLGNYTNIRLVVTATDAAYPAAAVTATVTSTFDQNPANNSGTDTIQVLAARDAVAELVSLPVMTVGTQAQLTFRARNVGTLNSTGATFTFALPPQVRFVGVASPGWRCTPGPIVTTCSDTGQISGFKLLGIRVKPLRPVAGAPITVTLTTTGDQNPANNTVVAPVSINPYVAQRHTVTGRSGARRTTVINVGDKLTVRMPQPRRGAKWRVRTASTAVSRPFVMRPSGRVDMRFTAKRAGRATLRFTRRAGRKTRKYTLVVRVVNPGA